MIDFSAIKQFARQFDTDMIKSVTDSITNEKKIEDIPCHLVLRQIDSPPGAGEITNHYNPVVVAGEVYTDSSIDVSNNDQVEVAKLDKAGEVIALYEGKAGTIAVRNGRCVFAFEINKVTVPQPEPPIQYSYWYFDDSKRVQITQPIKAYTTEIDGTPALVIVDEKMVFVPPRTAYCKDPVNGDVYIGYLSTRFWQEGSTRADGYTVQKQPQQLEDGSIVIGNFIR